MIGVKDVPPHCRVVKEEPRKKEGLKKKNEPKKKDVKKIKEDVARQYEDACDLSNAARQYEDASHARLHSWNK
jgi:hypothetical protein